MIRSSGIINGYDLIIQGFKKCFKCWSIGVFFGYLGLTAWGDIQYSDLVAVSILALTGGEPIGKALAKFAENKK